MSPDQPHRRRKSRAKPPHLRQKPGPKPRVPVLLEGRDYYCGTCTGHRQIVCPECGIVGCQDCGGTGYVKCPQCKGGAVPLDPPHWLSEG